jgi:hypothetical protein
MAKPYQHATLICIVLTILAFLGIVIGLLESNPLITIIFLFPAVIYEVYRTEGKSTKWASWGLLTVFIAEIILIVANVSFDLAEFLGTSKETVGGYAVPLGDIKVVGPAIMAILSLILFTRTRGRYTKWLAIIIFITSFVIVYTLDPTIFEELMRFGVKEGLRQI